MFTKNGKITSVSIPQAVSTVATQDKGCMQRRNSFNTASGKYCCNLVIKLMNQILNFLESFNTASGKYCCNHRILDTMHSCSVSIPQAVSTVATLLIIISLAIKAKIVSIPQAVSTVATANISELMTGVYLGFNTASGKYCCNKILLYSDVMMYFARFNTASGKYCCNCYLVSWMEKIAVCSFNTASGKYCCNPAEMGEGELISFHGRFQYRKR